MTRSRFVISRPVGAVLGVALAALVLWVWWAGGVTVTGPAPDRPPQPFVQLAGAGTAEASQILREKAELMDPTPLFFPTEWNYGQRPLRAARLRQPGAVFRNFAPKLTVNEQTIALTYGFEAPSIPDKLSDLLTQGNEAPFAGMGQVAIQKSTLPVRSGFLVVRKLSDSDNVIEQPLNGIQPPRSDFAPIEFLIAVGRSGLIGDPIVVSGSGWDEVDGFFRTYLMKSYHLGERLAPGRYRVLVGS